ncbi:MAG TPA: lantibiotic dehydratase, partial [Pseudonocardiaceae bacterium]|nr:lantibiotic dehydratase [Pseudonocardiaceae bacterium]
MALLRAAVRSVDQAPDWWPDPTDASACRAWLEQVWSRPDFADAIGQASPSLAHRVEAICAGDAVELKQLRRATVAAASYLLRALGRPTPFGLFAGTAPVTLGHSVQAQWGAAHRPVMRADTQWLVDVIERLQAYPQVL